MPQGTCGGPPAKGSTRLRQLDTCRCAGRATRTATGARGSTAPPPGQRVATCTGAPGRAGRVKSEQLQSSRPLHCGTSSSAAEKPQGALPACPRRRPARILSRQAWDQPSSPRALHCCRHHCRRRSSFSRTTPAISRLGLAHLPPTAPTTAVATTTGRLCFSYLASSPLLPLAGPLSTALLSLRFCRPPPARESCYSLTQHAVAQLDPRCPG